MIRIIVYIALICTSVSNLEAQFKKKKKSKFQKVANQTGFGLSFEDWGVTFPQLKTHSRQSALFTTISTDTLVNDCTPFCTFFTGQPFLLNYTVAFNPFDKEDNEYNDQQELRLGVAFIYKAYSQGFRTEIPALDTFQFAAYNYRERFLEVSVESAYLFTTKPGRRFVAYGGIAQRTGISLTSSVDEEVIRGKSGKNGSNFFLIETKDQYQAISTKPSLFVRVYISTGLRIKLTDRLALQLEPEIGLAARQLLFGATYVRPYYTGLVSFRVAW